MSPFRTALLLPLRLLLVRWLRLDDRFLNCSFYWPWGCQEVSWQQHSLSRNWMPNQLFRLLIHATSTSPWLLRPVTVSTSFELYPNYFRLPTFVINPPPPPPFDPLWFTCVAYRTPCFVSDHQMLSTQSLLQEAEDFPRGSKHSKHVPLLT